jgi:hypothetical protein
MASHSDVKPLADAIAIPILKAYKAGGLGLVFVFTGTFLLLVALFFGAGVSRYIVAVVGTCMIFLVLVFFYLQDIRKLQQAHERIEYNRDLVNTIQQTAIEMTDLAYTLQALAFKHADEVTLLLDTFRELLQNVEAIPLVSSMPGMYRLVRLADHPYVMKAEHLSSAIVNTTEAAKVVIEDLRNALIKSDPTLLRKYLAEIQEIEIKTKALLSEQVSK